MNVGSDGASILWVLLVIALVLFIVYLIRHN